MKVNKWTIALAAGGVVSLGSVVQAEEAQHQVLTALSQTTLSGYVDTSAIWKLGTGGLGSAAGTRAYDGASKLDGFNLNVVKLGLEKALDEAQWAAGYRVDLLFGPDSVTYQGAFASGGSVGSFGDDFAIQNAFVELRAPIGNGIDLKVGAFESPLGYETFDSGKNPNYSRSFGYILSPKQHTGVLASYQLADSLSIYGGVANTHTGAINGRSVVKPNGSLTAESEKTYLGGLTLSAPQSLGFLSGSTLYAGIVDGLAGAQNNTTSVYVGATIPTPLEGLSIGAAWDYRFDGVNGVTPAAGNNSNWASAIAGYVSYQATEKLKLNDRFDYVSGSDGTLGLNLGGAGSDRQPEIISNTVTLDYSLWDNVISRAEFRWDHSLTGDKLYGRGAGNQKNAFTLAANIIYKF
ncbi:MAG: hypothetical protein FJ398_10230 [Verrucomicrobia bacterium]|nr:hypothetical protein [Verrucomicrobiota bacterium]